MHGQVKASSEAAEGSAAQKAALAKAKGLAAEKDRLLHGAAESQEWKVLSRAV